ncbi:SURF1 family protein [Mycetocola manganoxydans]|uniref:SURF1-like protein n=1 Tax=Mycetocola manganoxydans TaxID=699879 RepID=A0A3L6ZVZ0_9MICO|nr:SURF1 family cytochrome oxidase biogenesis protein [Mycetocola manganoxydans]RLP72039.1 SURF1 family protein [Mycetocola manganoxydans]
MRRTQRSETTISSSPQASDPAQLSHPTLGQTMAQPRWIAMLLLALIVSGAFAWLGQWQLERAVVSTENAERPTESVVPLDSVATAGKPLRDDVIGQLVEVEGSWVPGDFLVITERVNLDVVGYWVAGHLSTGADADSASIAIALGWTEERSVAEDVAEELNTDAPASVVEITGRLNASQGAELPADGEDPFDLNRMSVAALVNIWPGMAEWPVYNAYVVADEAPEALVTIDAPAVEGETTVNWLNIFYAIEWVVFAGFAIFLWFRLVKDSWERDQEERELLAAGIDPETGRVE